MQSGDKKKMATGVLVAIRRCMCERSPVGRNPTVFDMAILTAHPLATGCPPVWASAWGQDRYGPWCAFRIGEVEQRMRWIPPGRFTMGSPKDEDGRWTWEELPHEVELTQGFWLFDTPCTQALWQAVMDMNPSEFKGENRPVEQVSWEDCQAFLAAFSHQLPELTLSLPAEAQWEHACRAGTTTARYHEDVDAIAWYDGNSDGERHDVGLKLPNAWGLYDMLGNVWEWCHDRFQEATAGTALDSAAFADVGANRIVRGGSWLRSERFA